MRILPITFLILFLGLSTILKSQDDFGVIYWTKERDLTWDDFKGESLMDTLDDFFLDLYIESISSHNSNYYSYNNKEAKVYVFTNTSFADEAVRNDDLLRYFNVYFDLAALYAHKVAIQLEKAKASEDDFYRTNLDIVKGAIVEEWRMESARFVMETQYGAEIERLLIWEDDVNVKLENIKEPKYVDSKYSLTFDFGMGSSIGLNDYDEYLSDPLVGLFGIEIAKAPFTYSFGISGGTRFVKKSFNEGNNEFLLDTDPNLLNIYLHTGYQLLKSKYLNLTPRVGIHFSNLDYPEDDMIESSAWAISYTGGITLDINLAKFRYREWNGNMMTNLGLRIAAYYYPINIGEQNLSNVLMTVGIYWALNGVNVEYN